MDNQPSFNASLKILDANPTKLINSTEKEILLKKAEKVNCICLSAWFDGPDVPTDVQAIREFGDAKIEPLLKVMPTVNGIETSKLSPFQAISAWIDMMFDKYQ